MTQLSGRSLYLSKAQSDNALGAVSYVAPATVYLALFTVAPTGGTGGTEATGSGYARLSITNNQTNFPASSGSATPATKSNGVTFTMATATGDWSTQANMVAWALFDASTSGNMLYYGPIGTPAPILSGNTPVFAASAIVISEA